MNPLAMAILPLFVGCPIVAGRSAWNAFLALLWERHLAAIISWLEATAPKPALHDRLEWCGVP
jgi:hypothetical protein